MIIFSAELASLSARENLMRTAEAEEVLGQCQTGTGVYQGTQETCLITSQTGLGKELARGFEQECYLERGHYGVWYLVETASGAILDTFKTIKEVTKERAEQEDNYTIMNGKYYLARYY